MAAPRSRSRRRVVVLALVVALLALWRPAGAHVRAASLLVRFADPDDQGFLASVARHPFDERDFALPGTRGRLYVPRDV